MDNLSFKKPGTEINAPNIDSALEKNAKKDLKYDDFIEWGDLEI